MAVTSARTGQPVKNNGATVVNGGSASTSGPVTNILDIVEIADTVPGKIGSKVVANDGTGANTTDRVGVSGVRAGATLAYNAGPTEWVMRGVTQTLAGQSNTALLSKGSDWNGQPKDNIFQLTTTRAYGSGDSTTYNMLAKPNGTINPNFVKGSGAGNIVRFVRTSDGVTAATDDAATPTRSAPGELVYRTGAKNPVMDDYKSREVFES